jgi:hypothetical protein
MSRSTMTSSIASTTTSSHGHKRDNQASTQHSICLARPPVIFIVKYHLYSLLKVSMN